MSCICLYSCCETWFLLFYTVIPAGGGHCDVLELDRTEIKILEQDRNRVSINRELATLRVMRRHAPPCAATPPPTHAPTSQQTTTRGPPQQQTAPPWPPAGRVSV